MSSGNLRQSKTDVGILVFHPSGCCLTSALLIGCEFLCELCVTFATFTVKSFKSLLTAKFVEESQDRKGRPLRIPRIACRGGRPRPPSAQSSKAHKNRLRLQAGSPSLLDSILNFTAQRKNGSGGRSSSIHNSQCVLGGNCGRTLGVSSLKSRVLHQPRRRDLPLLR